MEVPWNRVFEQQRRAFGFCFTCEDCRYFCPADETCLHGYPVLVHRAARYDASPPPGSILFCKEFELG